MSYPDRADVPRPAWTPSLPPQAPPAEAWDEPMDSGPGPHRSFSFKVVWRAARRYWWQIGLLWAIASVGLMALAYTKINPSYDAVALLQVRSSAPKVFEGTAVSEAGDFVRFQKTQVSLVTSPDVLSAALVKHPELNGLPLLRSEPDDREAAIRKALHVQIQPETSLFTVAMSSEDPSEALQIVDAVVEAYLIQAGDWSIQVAKGQLDTLREEASTLDGEIQAGRDKLRDLVGSRGTVDDVALNAQDQMSLGRFQDYLRQLDSVTMERIGLAASLQAARLQADRMQAAEAAPQVSREDLEQEIRNEPGIAQLAAERARAVQQLDSARRLARRATDPALVHAQRRIAELDEQIEARKRELLPRLQRQMTRQVQGVDGGQQLVQDLEVRLAATTTQEENLDAEIRAMKVEEKAAGGDALEIQLVQNELMKNENLHDSIKSFINQMEFDLRMPSQVARANARTQVGPSSNRRIRVMAMVPFGVMGLVLGMFVLLEIRAGRVADPEELATRARVAVMGVVPPLPSLRGTRALPAPGSRGEVRARRRLDEFVQSLDHLRVALCSGRQGDGRRCVMITSACSGEGKTTLTAHLAGRCANAGLSTLLIDADMRNPSLSRLLKVPDGPGLSDVLRGEIAAEATLTVIEAGGGFHLLPAGTSGFDPSRLLQDERLGQLIGQFRQAFDIILLDTPPVLLVPDALTLGRWVDGALLAVRYDTSRFPLVDRAQRRLAAVGVPVLGAVVNGARTMESSYGYSYAYSSSSASRNGYGPGVDPATMDDPAGPGA